jgi:membrane protein implicated in regulation of membrane protease activity
MTFDYELSFDETIRYQMAEVRASPLHRAWLRKALAALAAVLLLALLGPSWLAWIPVIATPLALWLTPGRYWRRLEAQTRKILQGSFQPGRRTLLMDDDGVRMLHPGGEVRWRWSSITDFARGDGYVVFRGGATPLLIVPMAAFAGGASEADALAFIDGRMGRKSAR